ncbi:MAG: DUF1127 domain-containing protein [Roseibium sp.]
MSSIETMCASNPPKKAGAIAQVFRIVGLVMQWSQTARSRRQLSSLTDAELKDIGVTRDQALREAVKPFWDGPSAR